MISNFLISIVFYIYFTLVSISNYAKINLALVIFSISQGNEIPITIFVSVLVGIILISTSKNAKKSKDLYVVDGGLN